MKSEDKPAAASDANPARNPNRARDHLANERTYLAWVRTAIALMGFGILIVKLGFDAPGRAWELGLAFAAAGMMAAGAANRRYFESLRAIEDDTFQPARHWITACTVIVIVMGLFVLLCLFATPGGPMRR